MCWKSWLIHEYVRFWQTKRKKNVISELNMNLCFAHAVFFFGKGGHGTQSLLSCFWRLTWYFKMGKIFSLKQVLTLPYARIPFFAPNGYTQWQGTKGKVKHAPSKTQKWTRALLGMAKHIFTFVFSKVHVQPSLLFLWWYIVTCVAS